MAKDSGKKKSNSLNTYVGWGLATIAMMFLNRRSSSSSSTSEPSDLSITSTKLGDVIPVVMGKSMIKSPLTTYWGDFGYSIYTEEYGMHSSLNFKSIINSVLLGIVASLIIPATHPVITSSGAGTATDTQNGAKFNILTYAVVNCLISILTSLISSHLGRTTIQKGFKYYLGYQQVLCWASPNARLRKVYMNEELVWEGDEPASKHTDGSYFIISVDDESLFGGPDENGGFVGELHVYFGNDKQTGDPWMKKQMQEDSIQAALRGYTPAYRPYISIVVPTAYVGKQATIPTMWYEVEIIPNELDNLHDTNYANIGEDANPAEVLYEIVTNDDWGLAEKSSSLDTDALKTVAKTLYDEKIGISVQLTSKEEARNVVDNICDHINAVRYADPTTAKMVHKLIRESDITNDMLVITTSNCSSITFTRQDWSNTVSEISVSYTDRAGLYETGTLSADDPANIEIQDGIKTTKSYDYSYFTTSTNALWAAKREMQSQGYPLATMSMDCNRELATVRIGDCVAVNFPPYGISNMVVRITNVDLSDFEDGTVKLEGMEDVFAIEKTKYDYSGSTDWKKDFYYPSDVGTWGVFETPYEMFRSPNTFVCAYAFRPDINTTMWTVWRRKSTSSSYESTNTMSKWTAIGTLVYDYKKERSAEDSEGFIVADVDVNKAITHIKYELDGSHGTSPKAARDGGKVLMIGNEIMSYTTLVELPNRQWKVQGVIRGIYDTVPQDHIATDTVIFLQAGHYANVAKTGPVCEAGKTVHEYYSIVTANATGKNAINPAIRKDIQTTRRAERPTVQGRIRLNAHALNNKYYADTMTGDVFITWIPRDRTAALGCVSQDDIAHSILYRWK